LTRRDGRGGAEVKSRNVTVASVVAVFLGLAAAAGQESAQEAGPDASPGSSQTEERAAPRSVWDGVYTKEQAGRGEALYVERCGECHGQGLEGDDISPPLIGSDFLWDWNGLTLGDLFERIVLSMPEENPRSMTPQQKADVLAFVLLQNEIPAGEKELASTKQELAPFRIDAVRPTAQP
jgi:cytochrome c